MSFREKAIACRMLASVSKCTRAIAESRRQRVVTTCGQWSRLASEVISAMKVHKPLALAKGTGYSYTMLWFIRSMLIASGVQQLNVSSTSVEELHSAFTAAKQRLSIFLQKQLIKTAMAEVCYSGRPTLFTMLFVPDREQWHEL